jgi:hypothetical protein
MRSDGLRLCRDQRVDIYSDGGRVQRIVDHPLNAPLIGLQAAVEFSRSAELTVRHGEKTIVVYSASAGSACRAATATIVQVRPDTLRFSQWQLEPGFVHQTEQIEGRAVHHILPGR